MDSKTIDTMTLISNQDGLTFAVMRNWHHLPSDDLSALEGYVVVRTMITAGSVYLTIRNMNPQCWQLNHEDIKFLKITTNEETGKLDFFLMDLTASEAEQIRHFPIALWD